MDITAMEVFDELFDELASTSVSPPTARGLMDSRRPLHLGKRLSRSSRTVQAASSFAYSSASHLHPRRGS